MKFQLGKLAAVCLLCGLYSCTSNDSKILGTWVPIGPDGKPSDFMTIHFLPGNKIVSSSTYDVKKINDTVTYEIKDDGKLLVTKEKSGRTDELVIVELTSQKLSMYLKNDARDTMQFEKQTK